MLQEDIKPLRFYPFVYLLVSIFPLINRLVVLLVCSFSVSLAGWPLQPSSLQSHWNDLRENHSVKGFSCFWNHVCYPPYVHPKFTWLKQHSQNMNLIRSQLTKKIKLSLDKHCCDLENRLGSSKLVWKGKAPLIVFSVERYIITLKGGEKSCVEVFVMETRPEPLALEFGLFWVVIKARVFRCCTNLFF